MQRHRIKIHLGTPEIVTHKQATKATNEGMGTVNQTQGHRYSGSKIERHESRHQTQTERQGHRSDESDQNKTRDRVRQKEKQMQKDTHTYRNRNMIMGTHRKVPRN